MSAQALSLAVTIEDNVIFVNMIDAIVDRGSECSDILTRGGHKIFVMESREQIMKTIADAIAGLS